MSDVAQPLASRIVQMKAEEKCGDYRDERGILICGKCHQPRETFFTGLGLSNVKVPIRCMCDEEEIAKTKKAIELQNMQARINELNRQSLIDERLRDATFDNFQVTRSNAVTLRYCKRFADGFSEMVEKNQGLLLWGPPGTGKSYAAACIANCLLQKRIPVVMTSFVKLIESMRGFDESEQDIINRLNTAKLLILDDLGAERGTEYALEKVYDVIDSRYRRKLPMILTTNMTLGEMKSAEDIQHSRIYDRVFENCYPIQFSGPSFRKREAGKRFDEMKNFLEGEGEK